MVADLETRTCGECTACCEGWLPNQVDEARISPGSPCRHCERGGCDIYELRPVHPCRTFHCDWLKNQNLPDWLIPSRSKVILFKGYFRWQRPSSSVLVKMMFVAGPKMPGRTQHWLNEYARENNFNYVCFEPKRENKIYTGELGYFGIGATGFVQEVEDWAANGYEMVIFTEESKSKRLELNDFLQD